MTTTEAILFLWIVSDSASVIWLYFERDRLLKKIKELELK